MTSEMRIAALQLEYPGGEAQPDRVRRVADLLRSAPEADMLVLPELWDVGYFDFDSYSSAAVTLNQSGTLVAVAAVAKERKVHVVAGSILERVDGAEFNTVVLIDSYGRLVGSYRKVHLFGYGSRERSLLTAGADTVVAATAIGNIGLATCFDLRFPEQFVEMRGMGADVIVVPAAWPALRREHWNVLTQARSIDTQTPVVACNGIGPCYGVDLAGDSTIFDAQGIAVASAGQAAGWFSGAISHHATAAWRDEFQLIRTDEAGRAEPVGLVADKAS